MKLYRDKSGLTLVEVVVASLILTMTFAGVMSAFTMARRSTSLTDNTSDGVHQARQLMEELWAVDYYDPPLSVGTHTVSNGYYVVTVNTNFYLTKDVTIYIQWVEKINMKTQTISLASSFSQAIHQ